VLYPKIIDTLFILLQKWGIKMSVEIIKDLCRGCKKCEHVCPNDAIKIHDKPPVDPDKCDDCEDCVFSCLNGAIIGGK